MGCSQSIGVAPRHLKGKENTLEPNDEEGSAARELDLKGRVTASDAHLISVQRGEETDVSPGLEDRWLRSHFSDCVNTTSIADPGKFEGIGQSVKTGEKTSRESDMKASIREIELRTSEDCATVKAGSGNQAETGQPSDNQRRLSILHFNDVYELTERKKEPVGGASRFASLLESVAERVRCECGGNEPLITFGGDCLNPSILSSATKGTHMVDVLNQLKVNAAVFGNHEFDFGVDHVIACLKMMNFPWFLSNVKEKFNGEPLGDGVVKQIIPWNGFQLGVMGLIEEEWLDTLTTVDKSELIFEDYVTRGDELAQLLKKDGADLVIALTHMRWPNDIRLAREVKSIDLILGGHDHEYGVKVVEDCVIVKSGSDFQTFSLIDLYLKRDGEFDVRVTRFDVTSATARNEEMSAIENRYMNVLEKQLQQPIGAMKTPLDGLYKHVRTRETNLGNFVADVMRMTTRAEIVLINSGTFRSNAVHSGEDFRVRDLMSILPIHDNVVILEVTGEQLLAGLENAVSKYPGHEGRFAQVSGFCFGFDPKSSPGNRILHESVRVHGEPLDLERNYKLATKAYVARGRDGYECFRTCRLFNDPDSGPVVSTVVRNHISNVAQLLRHQEITGDQLQVVEGGKTIISQDGLLHNVYSTCFEDAPVHNLQKSMEEIVPRNLDAAKSRTRRDSGLSRKRNFVENTDGRVMHMQHLLEINRDQIFEKSRTRTDVPRVEAFRRKAIEADRDNFKLLSKRQETHHDVRWQVLPLVEGRIFHCSKK